MSATNSEIEIKLTVPDAETGRKLICEAGFQIHVDRVFEANTVYDYDGLPLRTQGKIVRLRQAGNVHTLTFKGRAVNDRHKIREEIETTFQNQAAMERVFHELGLKPTFRYEKYRTEYSDGQTRGVVTLDETPIGVYLEIEGPAEWIDRTAARMGFRAADYITLSYGALYLQYCAVRGIPPSNMVFDV